MKKLTALICLIINVFTYSISQNPSIKILQYNLLYFGLYDDGCDQTNNNIDDKCDYLKTIINYAEPDIFAVNEIYKNDNVHEYLWTKVFALNNLSYYDYGEVKGSHLTSQVFYNTNTLRLKVENTIYTSPRNIHEYVFYYNSPDLLTGDTVFFSLFVAHLKAGDEYENDRAESANSLMSYIYSNDLKNYILSGDLNLYGSSEQAYQYLTNYAQSSYSFKDPCSSGEWHENSNYADYHTQSTSYSGTDCMSSGGLDDRFDFILFSPAIQNGTYDMEYVTSSFTTIGQDGEHFNDGVTYNGNSSVPANVLTALANNSDHLPVSAIFSFNQTSAFQYNEKIYQDIKIQNPANDYLKIFISDNRLISNNLKAEIYKIDGTKIKSYSIENFEHKENISFLSAGIYIISIYDNSKFYGTTKLIKQ